MRIDINIEAIDALKYLENAKKTYGKARKRGLFELSDAYRDEMRRVFETNRYGTWPQAHPFSLKYVASYKKGGRQFIYGRKNFLSRFSPYSWLGKFVRYFVKRDRISTITFGIDTPLSPVIDIASKIETVQTTAVTGKMRRLFGKAGFPLRGSTTALKSGPRPFLEYVFSKVNPEIFAKKFESVFKE